MKEGSGNDTMYYVLSDHLGSLTTIVNASTNAVENYSFNAQGIPRDPGDWTEGYSGNLFTGRGFTGHEHLTDFNLINMNAIDIREFGGNTFTPQDYSGWNTIDNYSLAYFTYGRESALQYSKSPYYKYGYNANHYSFGIGALPVGWSEARTYTWVGKRRERYQYKIYDFK